jgi:hypothetical protein
MNLGQVFNAYNGYFEREAERTKAIKIIEWETTRWQTWILYNLNVVKKHRINDPKKLIKFEWDSKPDKPDPEKMKKINDLFPDKLRGSRDGNK